MPATAGVVAARAALALLKDKRVRTALLSIIVGIIGTFIIIIGTFFSIRQGSQQSNQFVLGYLFNPHTINISGWEMPEEYERELVAARGRVQAAMSAVDEINYDIDGTEINRLRAGVIYLCLFPNGEITDFVGFAWCFARRETITEVVDDEEVIREAIIAITNESEVFANIQNRFGISIDLEHMENIRETYTFLTSGGLFLVPPEYTGPPSAAFTDETFARLMAEATQFIGWPYVWGGSVPAHGGFDCSGFIYWVYNASGLYSMPRMTAQGQYNRAVRVPDGQQRPGDLVFFQGTFTWHERITHVGIYVGNNTMLHAGNPIGYARIDSAFWSRHFAGFGRLRIEQ